MGDFAADKTLCQIQLHAVLLKAWGEARQCNENSLLLDMLQKKELESELQFLNAILNYSFNLKQLDSEDSLMCEETLTVNEVEFDKERQKIEEVCSVFKEHAEFIVAPFNDPEKFEYFKNSDLEVSSEIERKEKELATTFEEQADEMRVDVKNVQLAYHQAVTGKSQYGGYPQGLLLSEGYEQPLHQFLQDYKVCLQFFYENLDMYEKLSNFYQVHCNVFACQEMQEFFKDEVNFQFLRKLCDSSWAPSLSEASEQESQCRPESKVFDFATQSQQMINDFKMGVSLDSWQALQAVFSGEDQGKEGLQQFLANDMGAAVFFRNNQMKLVILAAVLKGRRRQYTSSGASQRIGPAAYQTLFSPSPQKPVAGSSAAGHETSQSSSVKNSSSKRPSSAVESPTKRRRVSSP